MAAILKFKMHWKDKSSFSFLAALYLGDSLDLKNDVEVFLSSVYVIITLQWSNFEMLSQNLKGY